VSCSSSICTANLFSTLTKTVLAWVRHSDLQLSMYVARHTEGLYCCDVIIETRTTWDQSAIGRPSELKHSVRRTGLLFLSWIRIHCLYARLPEAGHSWDRNDLVEELRIAQGRTYVIVFPLFTCPLHTRNQFRAVAIFRLAMEPLMDYKTIITGYLVVYFCLQPKNDVTHWSKPLSPSFKLLNSSFTNIFPVI
jgi:hypothetical protein